MKCISLKQPWATLIILGIKRQEIRTWGTLYRGQLAIHASRRFPEEARRLCQVEPFRSIFRKFGFRGECDLPKGAVLGVVQLADCRAIAVQDRLTMEQLAYPTFPSPTGGGQGRRPGCWVWEFTDPRPLARPLPFRGQMGIYNVMISEMDLTEATMPLLRSNLLGS
jgi:hypothetical protein